VCLNLLFVGVILDPGLFIIQSSVGVFLA
jgi:hypothetical protein